MIVDTDVLIWYLRGNSNAKKIVEGNLPFSVSAVTYIELIQGMKDKTEFRKLQKQIRKWKTEILHIDQEVSARALFYVQEYFLGHSMQMADALIAATAICAGDTLLTAYDKHYKYIPGLEIKKFTP